MHQLPHQLLVVCRNDGWWAREDASHCHGKEWRDLDPVGERWMGVSSVLLLHSGHVLGVGCTVQQPCTPLIPPAHSLHTQHNFYTTLLWGAFGEPWGAFDLTDAPSLLLLDEP